MGNLEKAGRLLRLMGWLSLIGLTVIFAAIMLPILSGGRDTVGVSSELVFWGLLSPIIPAIYLITGRAIKQGKRWGKRAGVVLGCVSLVNVPIGTVIGVAVLFYLKAAWDEGATGA